MSSGHAQPRFAVAGDVGGDVVLLELVERLPAITQNQGGVLGCAVLADLLEDVLAGGLGLFHPRVISGQHHFGLREVGRRAAQLDHQLKQALDGGQNLQILLLAVQVFLCDAQVLELADGVIRRQRLGELLQRIQPGVPVLGFFFAQQVLAPKPELALLQVGAGLEHARHQRTDFLLQFDDWLGITLAGLLGQAGRQVEQFEQGTQHREVDFFRGFDVLELLEFLQRTFCKLRQFAGVDLVAGDRQHDVAGVDQPAQHGDQQVGLQPVLDRREILDVRRSRQQFAAVQHLAVALGLESVQHFLRIA